MKITRLRLTNFRSHELLDLRELEPFTLVVGANADGKSSIALALEMLFAGRCAATDAAGHGADELIRAGATEARVEADVSGLGYIGRRWGAQASAVAVRDPRRSLPLKTAQQEIERTLGASTAVISATLGSWRFLQMPDADQRALLAEVLASRAVALGADVLEDMRIGGLRCGPAVVNSASELAGYHKAAFDLRTSLGRELREMGADDPPDGQPAVGRGELQADLQARRSTLAEIENSRAIRRETYARVAGRREEIERMVAQSETLMLDAADEAELEKEAESLGESRQLAARRAALAQAARRSESAATADEPEDGLLSLSQLEGHTALVARSESKDLREEASAAAETVQGLQAHLALVAKIRGAVCPTCERRLPPADRERIERTITDRLGDAQSRLASVRARIPDPMEARDVRAAIARHNEATAARQRNQARAVARESAEKLASELDAIDSRLRAIGDPESARERLDGHRRAAAARLRAAGELAALAAAGSIDTRDLDADAQKLELAIAEVETQLEAWREWDRRCRDYKSHQERRSALESRIAALTRVVEALAPKGPVASQLMGDRIAEFVERVNACLDPFGYHASVQLDPYRIAASRDGGAWHRLRLLSRSEQWRVGLAIQIALAQMSGLGMVVADEADVLDLDRRSSLTSMLLRVDLDQVIVLSTGVSIPAGAPPGTRFILLSQPVAESVAAEADAA